MIWLLACLFLLAAPLAHAQSTEIGAEVGRSTDPANDRDRKTINRAECIRNDTFTFTVTSSAPSGVGNYRLEVWAGTGCIDKGARITNPTCRLVAYDEASSEATTFDITAQEIVADGDGKEPEEATAEDCDSTVAGVTDITLYFILVDGNDEAVSGDNSDQYAMKFDMLAPDAPTGVSAGIGESALVVSWSEPDNTDGLKGYRFFCEPLGGVIGEGGATGSAGANGTPTDGCSSSVLVAGEEPPAGYGCGDSSGTATNGEATGLANGQTYVVAVASVDDYDNVGVLSQVACGTPEPVTGFFEAYRAAGGQAGGGFCAVHAGKSRLSAALVALALAGLVVRRRRQRRLAARRTWAHTAAGLAALVASSLTFSGTARAQGVDEFGAYGGLEDRGQLRSPQEGVWMRCS